MTDADIWAVQLFDNVLPGLACGPANKKQPRSDNTRESLSAILKPKKVVGDELDSLR